MEDISAPPTTTAPDEETQIYSIALPTPISDFDVTQFPPTLSPETPPRPGSPSQVHNMSGQKKEELESINDSRRIPARPHVNSSSSYTPLDRFARLLPLDPSAYSDPFLPSSALTTSTITLSELAHLIRLQRHTEQRRSHSRVRLHRWLVSAGLSARLLQCGQSAYRTLMDYFRNDEKEKFAALHSALHDVRMSCDATRRYALLEPDLGNSKANSSSPADSFSKFSTFLHEIPSKSRLEILAFVCEIRNNPDFLAARIASLSEAELKSLSSFRHSSSELSVLASAKTFGQKKGSVPVARPVERLLSFHRHDPLSALIYTVFANSSGPDSSEDIRRTDAWATTCARMMLEHRPGWEQFTCRVFDVWADMREWSLKENLEIYLMQVLQEGQFLLEKAENIGGATVAGPENTKPLKYAAEEFFDRSVKNLMALVDGDEYVGGLPEGILEIGRAILSKLRPSPKHKRNAEVFILVHWFFGSYLNQALVSPETHGIMVGYHISQLARERILAQIASRARMQILAIFNNVQSSIVVMPEVKKNIGNLFDRLRRPKAHGKPILLPAKAVTSPRETMEVQPFLVLSPADIATLVHALFPDRSKSLFSKEPPKSGLTSSASSISGISIPVIATTPRDGSSILSRSVSSMTSDSTSRDAQPFQDFSEPQEHMDMPIEQREAAMVRPVPTEEYGRKLREACSEMAQSLGSDAVAGTCHPCADRWAVLHISRDGKELLTRMRKDVDYDDQEDDSLDSDSDDESTSYGVALENDYHQLKDAIVRLLSEYELPKVLSEATAFSNGQSPRRERRNRTKRMIGDGPNQLTVNGKPLHRRRRSSSTNDDVASEKVPDLVIMLETANQQCESRGEWLSAITWHKTLDQLKKLSSPSLTRDGYGPLLHYFGRGPRDSLARCFSAIDEFEAWFVWLKQSQERYESRIDQMMRNFKNLRDKMWYKTMVMNSAGYDDARNLATALKMMGNKIRPGEALNRTNPTHKRGYSRSSLTTGNFLLRTEAQVLDLLAASNDHCGPNKLSDEQVELTTKWLKDFNIERNFCQSEERIHRFTLEIDKCVNKFVGDSPSECPVLWSSDLYKRDQHILNGGRSDAWLTGMGLCIPEADSSKDNTRKHSSRSLDFVQKPSSLRTLSTKASQSSLLSSDWSGNTKTPLNIMDSQDYFGGPSPTLEIDSSVTFWSPFQANSGAEKDAESGDRPKPSMKSSTKKSTAAYEDERQRFLIDLKRSLTGLMLSDLGSLVFNTGSETDGWFSEEIVDDCIKMKEAEELKRKAKLARKKSKRNLRNREQATPATQASTNSERTSPMPNSTPEVTISNDIVDIKKSGREFPYKFAYEKLLRRFSTHPNPFTKLDALHHLKILIEHQLVAPAPKHISLRTRRDEISNPRDSPNLHSPLTVTGSGRGSPADNPTVRVVVSNSPPSNNSVIDVMRSLFSDPLTRPKTLFRDLQYISAFIPTETLYKTAYGRAFSDASVAAVGLKDDVVRQMVDIADRVVQEHTDMRPSGSSQTPQQPSSTTSATAPQEPSSATGDAANTPQSAERRAPKYSMSDAAHMYQLAALEGNAAAERELAIFYLTQPEITPRIMQPLAKAKDVFKNVEKMLSTRRNKAGEEDNKRSDPLTLCLAHHWMEQSKIGGDELAANYLRDRDDIERIPGV